MKGFIYLLPEYVANQIAAGEVVNRPSSAVKELMENAVDSGADEISLYVEDAGKTLIKVCDNGCGMQAEDAERCFLRHATSKIKTAQDLFALRTMGFRGEALASIAAIAQVELKTKTEGDAVGTQVRIEGETIKEVKSCTCSKGTQISVKNIYFNTPARRQFLKSDSVEYRYMEEEFIRVAMANNSIKFSLYKDKQSIYKLSATTKRQRIVQLMGKSFEQRMVAVKEQAGKIKVEGFICTPDYATKNRSKQYLFVNGRYIKHIGLTHAVETAYKQLIPDKTYPAFFLFLQVDPTIIDVNIHPTKTEIRFEDEKLIYGVLLSIVKHSIGLNQMAPILDFDNENAVVGFSSSTLPAGVFPEVPTIKTDPTYNPFDTPYKNHATSGKVRISNTESGGNYSGGNYSNVGNYSGSPIQMQSYMEQLSDIYTQPLVMPSQIGMNMEEEEDKKSFGKVLQLGCKFIVTTLKSGLLVIDQQAATERIIYERYKQDKQEGLEVGQRILFPQTLELSPSETEVLKEIKDKLRIMGWEIEWVGGLSFMVNATPSRVKEEEIQGMVEGMVETYMSSLVNMKGSGEDNVKIAMARQMAVKAGVKLEVEEMLEIINQLFASTTPSHSPSGRKVFNVISIEELQQGFKK